MQRRGPFFLGMGQVTEVDQRARYRISLSLGGAESACRSTTVNDAQKGMHKGAFITWERDCGTTMGGASGSDLTDPRGSKRLEKLTSASDVSGRIMDPQGREEKTGRFFFDPLLFSNTPHAHPSRGPRDWEDFGPRNPIFRIASYEYGEALAGWMDGWLSLARRSRPPHYSCTK